MIEPAPSCARRFAKTAVPTAALGAAVFFFCSASAWAGDFEKGRDQYHRTCAQCHGRNMVTSGVTVYDLRRFPAEQRERFLSAVTNGKGDMPSFRDALSEEQLRTLWVYVSSRGAPPQ